MASPEKWRPIETAPKDGTRFLACEFLLSPGRPVAHVFMCHYWAGDHQNAPQFMRYGAGSNPTHWTPLPAPPEGREK